MHTFECTRSSHVRSVVISPAAHLYVTSVISACVSSRVHLTMIWRQKSLWDALLWSSRNSEGPYTYHPITAVQTIQVKCPGSASSRRGE